MKFNMTPKFKEIALQVAGSHYPDVGGKNLETFGKMVIDEMLVALEKEPIQHGEYGYNQSELHRKLKKHFGLAHD